MKIAPAQLQFISFPFEPLLSVQAISVSTTYLDFCTTRPSRSSISFEI